MINRISLALCLIATVQSKPGQDMLMVCNNLVDVGPRLRDAYGNFFPTWESLDSRELPEWYQDAKIGILVHWGVYSVPSFGSEWFWNHWKTETDSRKFRNFMERNYKPGFAYQDFAHDFTAEFYNATEWVELFKASGAKYVVLTSKYHDGYTLWPSKYSINWNSMDVGPHRDLVGELADAVRTNSDLRFGLYHSLIEWYNPLWLEDSKNNFTTDKFVLTKVLPEMHEIVEKYRPEIFWSDGDEEAPDTYWKSEEFIAYLYNESPVRDTVVVNDRWGDGTACQHGDFYTCEDRYNPELHLYYLGQLLSHKWEDAMTVDKISWGYRRNALLEDYMTTAELIAELASTVSCGGNLLINVGATKEGIIHPIFQDRLRELGKWLKVNGEAIYNTWPRHTQNDTITGDIWYTVSNDIETIYAIVLTWPEDNVLQLGAMRLWKDYTFFLLGYSHKLKWRRLKDRIEVDLPPCGHRGQPAWVVKIKFKSRSNN